MISVYHLNPKTYLEWVFVLDAKDYIAQAQLYWQTCKYELVADVLTDDLEQAYRLTNTIDQPWWGNADVTPRFIGCHTSGGCRSTSVGDLLQTDTSAFLVLPVGFAEIQLPEQIEGDPA